MTRTAVTVRKWTMLIHRWMGVELNDASVSSFYIDPRSGRVVQSYGTRSRWDRWLYHGLHSFDLPVLYAHRPAWDIIVLALMAGGTALSFTGATIAKQEGAVL